MGDGKFVSARDLGLENSPGLLLNLRHTRENTERSAITQALCIAEGKISAAAKLLGVTRPTLYDLMKKYQLRPQTSDSGTGYTVS